MCVGNGPIGQYSPQEPHNQPISLLVGTKNPAAPRQQNVRRIQSGKATKKKHHLHTLYTPTLSYG
jgi:hypothetical protein